MLAKSRFFAFLSFLSGLENFGRSFSNIFVSGQGDDRTRQKIKYKLRDVVILFSVQTIIIVSSTWLVAWWAYLVLWVFPIYFFAFRADLTRVFCEHSGLFSDADLDSNFRLVSYKCNWLEKIFFAPHNMHCHISHHLWPSIPYYNLLKTEKWLANGTNVTLKLFAWSGELPISLFCINIFTGALIRVQ